MSYPYRTYYQLNLNSLRIEEASHNGNHTILKEYYFIADDIVYSDERDGLQIALHRHSNIVILHSQASVLVNLAKVGGLLGGILALWSAFNVMLKNKYRNTQS